MPEVAVGIVNVQLPVSVYDNTVPLASEMVCVVDELTMAGAVSRYAVTVGLVRTGVVSVLAVRVCVDPKLTRVSVALGRVYE